MQSQAQTVEDYLAELPEDRRQMVQAVREVILANLPDGFEEGMQYGMIGYFVPHSLYPAGYHCDPRQPLPFAHLASQKNHISVYLFCIYGNEKQIEWFQKAWLKTGRKLNMGKSCVRFRKLEDVPLDVIGQAVKRFPLKKFVTSYETATQGRRRGTSARPTAATKKKTATKRTRAARTNQPAAGRAGKKKTTDRSSPPAKRKKSS